MKEKKLKQFAQITSIDAEKVSKWTNQSNTIALEKVQLDYRQITYKFLRKANFLAGCKMRKKKRKKKKDETKLQDIFPFSYIN